VGILASWAGRECSIVMLDTAHLMKQKLFIGQIYPARFCTFGSKVKSQG